MVSQYGTSKYGRSIVISEDHVPTLRKVFVAITLVIGVGFVLNAFRLYFVIKNRQRRLSMIGLPRLVTVAYVLYILNILIHNAHYADNIYKPIDYYEPEWLYRKYLFETMEITFFINFPIMICGAMCMARLFNVTKDNLRVTKSACYGLFGFVAGSLLTLLHYRNEPPTSYKAEVNFTIAGEGAIALIFCAIVFVCLRMANEDACTGAEEEILLPDEELIKGSATRRSPRPRQK